MELRIDIFGSEVIHSTQMLLQLNATITLQTIQLQNAIQDAVREILSIIFCVNQSIEILRHQDHAKNEVMPS